MRAIEKILAGIGLPKRSVKSVVVFVGDGKLKQKQELPQNVTVGFEAARYVRSFKTRILTDEQVEKICTVIESSRMRRSRATNRQHIQNLKHKTAPDLRICPECGRRWCCEQHEREQMKANNLGDARVFPSVELGRRPDRLQRYCQFKGTFARCRNLDENPLISALVQTFRLSSSAQQ